MGARISLVCKIGSMALIRKGDDDIDYNIFARLAGDLRPGMILVSSGATEIGRIDHLRRAGCPARGTPDEVKTDYAAQGQAILMENYRRFVDPRYGVRQVLVEHNHFNDPARRAHIESLLMRAAEQDTIPIVNYNDAVSDEENRKLELAHLSKARGGPVVECVDNDETAAVITLLMNAPTLLIYTSAEGVYRDPADPATRVDRVGGRTPEELERGVHELMDCCRGASRAGAGGARAKLLFALRPALKGTRVIIGSPRYHIDDLLSGRAPCTQIGLGL